VNGIKNRKREKGAWGREQGERKKEHGAWGMEKGERKMRLGDWEIGRLGEILEFKDLYDLVKLGDLVTWWQILVFRL